MRLPSLQELRKKHGGFTLIEFAIVMVLSGLLLAAMLHAYKVYLTDKYVREVRERQKTLSSSFSVYYSARSRYPCPADPTLPFNSPDAGIEGIAGASADRCLNLLDALPNDGDCTGPGGTGICRADSVELWVDDVSPAPVFIGSIPYKSLKTGMEKSTICYSFADGEVVECDPGDPTQYNPTDAAMSAASLNDSLDPWGFQMTYAVTASQTIQSLFNPSEGVIGIFTENGDPLLDPENSAHFVIISHGENHFGAYNQEGFISFPCPTGASAPSDAENCNNDYIFTSGLRRLGGGVTYFDDTLLYRAYTLTELWKFNTTDPAAVKMYNANTGKNVGIGVVDPEVKLHVGGDSQAGIMHSNQICDATGLNCWEPEKLGGTGMRCPEPDANFFYVPRGIKNGDFWECTPVPRLSGFEGLRCPPGEYVIGLRPGGLDCRELVY